LSYPILSLFL
jgi:hypothetical protein